VCLSGLAPGPPAPTGHRRRSACAPQASPSGAVSMVVESMLGLDSEPADPRIHLRRPRLPSYINWLKIRSLRHADAEQPRPPGYRIEITGDARACRGFRFHR
jgi:hypothetical protein